MKRPRNYLARSISDAKNKMQTRISRSVEKTSPFIHGPELYFARMKNEGHTYRKNIYIGSNTVLIFYKTQNFHEIITSKLLDH